MTSRISNGFGGAKIDVAPAKRADDVPYRGLFGLGDFDDSPTGPGANQPGKVEPRIRTDIYYRRRPAWLDVVSRTTYTFSGKANSTQSFPLTAPLRARDWRTGVLLVRLHDSQGLTATAIVSVLVQSLAPSPDQPAELFVQHTIANVQFTSSDVPPGLFTAAMTLPITPYLRTTLELQQGATEAMSPQTITLSARIGGRRA